MQRPFAVEPERAATSTVSRTQCQRSPSSVPLEPKVEELKFYAPNVGPLLSVHTDSPGGRAELVSYTPGK